MSASKQAARVVIAEPRDFSPRALELLRGAAEVELRALTQAELGKAFAEFDVVWLRLGLRVDEATLGPSPRCRLIACPATGLDHIDLEACARLDISVSSLRGETEFLRGVRATAELTLALALALVRRLPAAAASVLDGSWDRDRFRGHELFEKCVGIVGVGRLGTLVANYFAALGLEVIGYDPRPDWPEGIRRAASLDELLRRADLLSLHVSYGPATHHLIAEKELSLVKPSSVLVNTSRGGVVDSRALLAALRGGRLAGAALDVIEGEPQIGRDHPLLEYARAHENLIIVPHIGGSTVESLEKAETFVARKVVAALAARGA